MAKRCRYQSKNEVNEQFGREMNQDIDGNKELFWNEVNKVNGRKEENYSRIKDCDGRLALEEDEARRIWKNYFHDLYNIDSREQVAVSMCSSYDGVQRFYYFSGKLIGRTAVELRVGKVRVRSLERL